MEITEETRIDYRYFNMDTKTRTTELGLLEYAAKHRGGMHRCTSEGVLQGAPVLIGYGTKGYDMDDLKALNRRLSRG